MTNPHDSLPAIVAEMRDACSCCDLQETIFEWADRIEALAQRGEAVCFPDATHWLDDDTGEVQPAGTNPNNPPDGWIALCPRSMSVAPSRGEPVAWRFYITDDPILNPFWTGWSTDVLFRTLTEKVYPNCRVEYAYAALPTEPAR